MKTYDDDEMVNYILTHATSEELRQLDDDKIIYLTDLVDEFLESRGYFDEEDPDLEALEDILSLKNTELYDFVVKNIKRDDFEDFPLSPESFKEFLALDDDYRDTLEDEE
ncbi:hypothetical protein [Porphyromonas canoris]|uniref:Uncharacterized protein n=1 Tax=Porphyromonas canoris TaxID=36875 RepID=A0ABR4XJR2_9PORP|nr:hypothetical protein [Porphyromonas canoris]KGN91939.1 hypothetical protein HQ43_07715 [Porphyromonas canoris]